MINYGTAPAGKGQKGKIMEQTLYRHLGIDTESIPADKAHGYLTTNTGRDGAEYLYYLDEHRCGILNTSTGEIITDGPTIERLLA